MLAQSTVPRYPSLLFISVNWPIFNCVSIVRTVRSAQSLNCNSWVAESSSTVSVFQSSHCLWETDWRPLPVALRRNSSMIVKSLTVFAHLCHTVCQCGVVCGCVWRQLSYGSMTVGDCGRQRDDSHLGQLRRSGHFITCGVQVRRAPCASLTERRSGTTWRCGPRRRSPATSAPSVFVLKLSRTREKENFFFLIFHVWYHWYLQCVRSDIIRKIYIVDHDISRLYNFNLWNFVSFCVCSREIFRDHMFLHRCVSCRLRSDW